MTNILIWRVEFVGQDRNKAPGISKILFTEDYQVVTPSSLSELLYVSKSMIKIHNERHFEVVFGGGGLELPYDGVFVERVHARRLGVPLMPTHTHPLFEDK